MATMSLASSPHTRSAGATRSAPSSPRTGTGRVVVGRPQSARVPASSQDIGSSRLGTLNGSGARMPRPKHHDLARKLEDAGLPRRYLRSLSTMGFEDVEQLLYLGRLGQPLDDVLDALNLAPGHRVTIGGWLRREAAAADASVRAEMAHIRDEAGLRGKGPPSSSTSSVDARIEQGMHDWVKRHHAAQEQLDWVRQLNATLQAEALALRRERDAESAARDAEARARREASEAYEARLREARLRRAPALRRGWAAWRAHLDHRRRAWRLRWTPVAVWRARRANAAFGTWRGWWRLRAEGRRLVALVLARLRPEARPFTQWRERAAERRETRRQLTQVVARLRGRREAGGLARWVSFARERRDWYAPLQRAAARWRSPMAAPFAQWRAAAAAASRVLRVVQRVHGRWGARGPEARALATWHDAAATQRRGRQRLAWAATRLRGGPLVRGWRLWCEAAAELRARRDALATAAVRWTQLGLVWAWGVLRARAATWRALRVAGARWVQPGLARALGRWRERGELLRAARRAMHHWQGALLVRVFDGWVRAVPPHRRPPSWRGGGGRWRRLRALYRGSRALARGVRYVATHPKQDAHAVLHPRETFRRLRSSSAIDVVRLGGGGGSVGGGGRGGGGCGGGGGGSRAGITRGGRRVQSQPQLLLPRSPGGSSGAVQVPAVQRSSSELPPSPASSSAVSAVTAPRFRGAARGTSSASVSPLR